MASVRNQSSVYKRGHQGFTLVEILIAASLSLVVFSLAFTAMIRFSRVHYSLATQSELDRQFRYAINLLTDDFRGLSSIEIMVPTDKEAEDGELTEVTISLPNIENASGVMPDRTEILYAVNDKGVLRRIYAEYSQQGTVIDTRTTRVLDNVSAFNVERLGGSSSFDLTLASSRKAAGKDYAKLLTTRVASRN